MKRARPSGSNEFMYTAAEIAALTKVSVRTVRRWLAAGGLR